MNRLALLASALALTAGSAGPTSAQAPAAAITAPVVNYHVRVLPNGLKLYTVLDKTTPNVTVQVWYGVGAKNDPARPLRLRPPVRAPDVQGRPATCRRNTWTG